MSLLNRIQRRFCSTSPSTVNSYKQIIWFCKPGHENLLSEEVKLNTNGKVAVKVDKGWIRVKQTSDVNIFTEPAWGRVCMNNFQKFSDQKESELLKYGVEYSSKVLSEMMSETHPYSQWVLFSYEPGMNAHQGLVSSLSKNIRKNLLKDKKFKKRMLKKGIPDAGDMMVQMFMPSKNTIYISAAFAESDSLGREQPLHWLGGHYKAKHNKGPSKADTKIQEAFAHFDIEDEQIEGSTVLELGGAPGGWTSFLLEKGALVTSIDLADSTIDHKNHNHIKDDAKKHVETFKDGVDWLVADLSMPPDISLDLLFQYLSKDIPKRFLWSIKFSYHPNDDWNSVIQNARKMFKEKLPQYNFRIRHLFYQKREILIWGLHNSITEEYKKLQDEMETYVVDSEAPDFDSTMETQNNDTSEEMELSMKSHKDILPKE